MPTSNYLLSDFHVSGIHCKLYAYVLCCSPRSSLKPIYSVKSPTGGVIVSCQASNLTRIRPHIPHTSPGYVEERHQGQRGSLQAHVGHPHARRRTQYSGIAKFVCFACYRSIYRYHYLEQLFSAFMSGKSHKRRPTCSTLPLRRSAALDRSNTK